MAIGKDCPVAGAEYFVIAAAASIGIVAIVDICRIIYQTWRRHNA